MDLSCISFFTCQYFLTVLWEEVLSFTTETTGAQWEAATLNQFLCHYDLLGITYTSEHW